MVRPGHGAEDGRASEEAPRASVAFVHDGVADEDHPSGEVDFGGYVPAAEEHRDDAHEDWGAGVQGDVDEFDEGG